MKLKKFIIRDISLFICASINAIFACGGGDYEGYDYFFDPSVIHDSSMTSYFRDLSNRLFSCSNPEDNIDIFKEQNCAEWGDFFRNAIEKKPLTYMLYTSTINQIDSAIFILKKTMRPPLNTQTYEAFLKYDNPSKVIEFLYYVGFARRCEPLVAVAPGWNKKPDSAQIYSETAKLLTAAQKQLNNVKDPFIYERYLFQIIRLFFKAQRYDECIAFYEKNIKKISTSPSIEYRSLSFVAGSYYRLGNFTKSNVCFAQIFDRYPPLRCVAGFSFHPQTGNEWGATLNEAKEKETKEALSFLRGLYGDPIGAMQEIYALNPMSDYLNLLCVRAINIMEEDLSNGVNQELLDFALKVANEGKANKPWVWNLAAGHLSAFQGNTDNAEKYLQKATISRKEDTVVQTQAIVSRFIGTITALSRITPDSEDALFDKFDPVIKLREIAHSNTSYSAITLARRKLAQLYSANDDLVKAECLVSDNNFYASNSNIDMLIAFLQKKNKNRFESLITGTGFIAATTSLEELKTLQAFNAIKDKQFDKALEYFKLSGNASVPLCKNPFAAYWNDWTTAAPLPQDDSSRMSRIAITENLILFNNQTAKKQPSAAEAYYRLGNFYFNTFKYGTSYEFSGTTKGNYPNTTMYYDPQRALQNFKLALANSPTPELKAKIYAMIAKYLLYQSDDPENENFEQSGEAYKKIKEECSKTTFYKEMIKECGYFRTFLGIKK